MHEDAGPLDVLIVAQPTEYGVAVCVRQQTEAAVSAGHNVVVACPDATHGPLADWVERVGAAHHPLNMQRQPGWSDVGAVVALRRLMRGKDVVHLHSSKSGAVGRTAAATLPRNVRPVVLFTTHYWSWQVDSRFAGIYRWVERFLASRCDAIVAVSHQEAAEGRATLGRAGDRIVVIPNGIDRSQFTPDGDTAPREDGPLVVCVGRLSAQKGQDIAIEALARLSDRRAKLRLVGDEYPAGQQRQLQDLASRLGVADRVEWWGKVSDTAPQFRAADVVVAPSRWEGMSLVLLEAMACGAAIIASDVFGSQALGEAGIIVPVDDAAALTDALDDLLADEERRRVLGTEARERSSGFDLDLTLSRTLRLWSDLAQSRTPISVTAER